MNECRGEGADGVIENRPNALRINQRPRGVPHGACKDSHKGAQVIDVSPLSGLVALQSLDLNVTPVADGSALAYTTGLKITGKRRRRLAPIPKAVVTPVRVT
jgi:hypothetical protein